MNNTLAMKPFDVISNFDTSSNLKLQLDLPDYVSLKNSHQLQLERKEEKRLRRLGRHSLKTMYAELQKSMLVDID